MVVGGEMAVLCAICFAWEFPFWIHLNGGCQFWDKEHFFLVRVKPSYSVRVGVAGCHGDVQ